MNDHDLLRQHIEEDKQFKQETADELKAIRVMLEPVAKLFTESRSFTKIIIYILGGIVFINSIIVATHSLYGFISNSLSGK